MVLLKDFMQFLLRLFIFLICGHSFVLFGQSAIQNKFEMDRYVLSGENNQPVQIDITNQYFAFDRISIETPKSSAEVVIEKIIIRSNNSEIDLWLTPDSVMFFAKKNPQTAWIRRYERFSQIVLGQSVGLNERLRIVVQLRIGSLKHDAAMISEEKALSLTIFHSENTGRTIRLAPAQKITIKP
jgi:hypothetical protein